MLNLLKLPLTLTFCLTTLSTTYSMHQSEEATQRQHEQILHSITTKTTPYVDTGECLARQHIFWEEQNGIRPKSRYELHEYRNTPISQEHYRSLWVQAGALYRLCQEHNTINPTTQPLAHSLPFFLAVKIGHPQGNNLWFLYQDVAHTIEQIQPTHPENEPCINTFE